MTILGTRPEIIRLSRVIERLDNLVQHVLVHTGQNYDFSLNDLFFKDLGVRSPDYFLEANDKSLGKTLANIILKTEEVLLIEKPDAVLILGDTNSSISSIIARKLQIPIYHVEAGNRCFDLNVPEETNRRIIDHIADFNLVYTEHARNHLLSEGLEHRRIVLSGSPMKEVLDHYSENILKSKIIEKMGLENRKYMVASFHREENVDNPDRLKELFESLSLASNTFKMPVILSTHPRTLKRINKYEIKVSEAIKLSRPFGFFDYNSLQINSFCTISDSGTISEESSLLGFPAITPRDSIERPEAIDVGSIILTGIERHSIINGIKTITDQFYYREINRIEHPIPRDYCITNSSERIVNLIIGTSKLSNLWDGIRQIPKE